jgi:hypothetical protein
MGISLDIGKLKLGSSSGNSWTSHYVYLKSGDIWYRREINRAGGYFALDYSEDAGVTWTNLITLDLTESDPLIDLAHIYRHRIVDFEYHIDQTLTPTGYAGTEGVDWSNVDVHSGGYVDWTTRIAEFNIVTEGHSFMDGWNRCSYYSIDSVNSVSKYISAVSGSSVTDVVTRQATVDSKLVAETDTLRNILLVWIGANDMNDTVGCGVTTYNALKSYVNNRVTAGWKVYVFTMTPSTTGRTAQFETERGIFNGLLKSDLASSKVFILDTDTLSVLNDTTNTDYYIDLLHLTGYGFTLCADLFMKKIEQQYAVKKSLGTELIDQALWCASGLAWWNDYHQANWSGDGVKCISDGNSGVLSRSNLWTTGVKYKVDMSITVASGTLNSAWCGTGDRHMIESTKDFIFYFNCLGETLYNSSNSLNGSITKYSIKEVTYIL